ncbi:MAG: hypothetical protein ACTHOG_01800 [Marmoricola sp.]
MTTYEYGTQTASSTDVMDEASAVKDQAARAASTAADEGRGVAEAAKNEAKSVAEDAEQQVRSLLDDARQQVEDQSRTQLQSLVGTLQGFATDLERMASGEGAGAGVARDVVTEISQKVRSLSDQLNNREPSEVLDQARGFARQRPGTFLLGSLAAGVVAGRLARGAKDAKANSSTGGGSTTSTESVAAHRTEVPPPPVGYSIPPAQQEGTAEPGAAR